MSLSNEAIIAIVALVFTLGPLLDQLWRYYRGRQQALAARRASLDTEMQLMPARSPQPSASPPCRPSTPIAAPAPLHRYPEYRLHEQMQVVCVAAYKQFVSRYFASLHEPLEEEVMVTPSTPSGEAAKSQGCTHDNHAVQMAEDEMNAFVIE